MVTIAVDHKEGIYVEQFGKGGNDEGDEIKDLPSREQTCKTCSLST